MKQKFVDYFTSLVKSVSQLSTCYSRKVGALIISQDYRILATGYNGVPSGYFECNELASILSYIYDQQPMSISDVEEIIHKMFDQLIQYSKIVVSENFLPLCLQNLVDKYSIYKTSKLLNRLLTYVRYKSDVDFSYFDKQSFIRQFNFIHYKYEIHAEQNAIAQVAKYGTRIDDAIMFITMAPCLDCARLIVASGIRVIYCLQDYVDKNYGESSLKYLKENNIGIELLTN